MPTDNAVAKPNVCDTFYADQTPTNAVALAIGDHCAANQFPMWEYIGALRTAKDQCEEYPRLLAERAELLDLLDGALDSQECNGYIGVALCEEIRTALSRIGGGK